MIHPLLEANRPFRAREVARQGVDPWWLGWTMLPSASRLERGVYGRQGRQYPHVLIASVRSGGNVACLYSALWLHGLLFREPPDAWLYLGHKDWKPRIERAQFVRTRLGVTEDDIRLLTDCSVPATSLARTVVDFYRLTRRVGPAAARVVHQLVLETGACSEAEIEACARRLSRRGIRRPPGQGGKLESAGQEVGP